MVKIKINDQNLYAREGENILKLALKEGIDIPHLCYHEIFEEPYGACRLCIVEVIKDDERFITTSCTLQAQNGLEILTQSPEVVKHRKILLELYLAQAPNAENIKKLAEKYGIEKSRFPKRAFVTDHLNGKCILCGLCIRVCGEVMKAGVINYIGRGPSTKINTPFFEENPDCLGCLACVSICPTEAVSAEEVENRKILKSWSETKVKMKECKNCGSLFTTYPLWEKTKSLLMEMDTELEELCPNCKRELLIKKLTKNLPLPKPY